MIPKIAYIPSRSVRQINFLSSFLSDYQITKTATLAECVMEWGLDAVAPQQHLSAGQEKKNLPLIMLEDGFICSLDLGVHNYQAFSLVVDNIGIYYDTTRPSYLEQLILENFRQPENAEHIDAQAALDFILEHCLSKYNHAPLFQGFSQQNHQTCSPTRVLVVDQTFGDMAVRYGQADESDFVKMLQVACDENPDAEIWVKVHPYVLNGKKRGYFSRLPEHSHVRFFTDDVNSISLLKQVDKVYCVTSQMGFEALLCGKDVVTFGVPWYCAWGLTDDRHPAAQDLAKNTSRRVPRSLLQLFQAAYFDYARYINPSTGERGTIWDVLQYLRREAELNRLLAGDVYCVGMSLWRQSVVKPFLRCPATRLHFVSSVKKLQTFRLPENSKIVMWGQGKKEIEQFAAQQQLPLLHMEDGFIRSVGLGSNLVPALSLVLDNLGIYFNATQTSRLENILQNQVFSDNDLITAKVLQQQLLQNNISKYNVGSADFRLPESAKNKKVILVPGQVEDDASIRFGAPNIHKNADLLMAVRKDNPDAFIIYKPHPDVVSGNRIGHIPEHITTEFADLTVPEIDILSCLNAADEVHTMTSLTGFEALLRDKKVVCYGLPFYAGWGLTEDKLNLPRRTRRLTLPELLAGTLMYYPIYVNHDLARRIDAQTAIKLLAQQKHQNQHNTTLQRHWLAKQFGKLIQLYRSLRY
ncbi:MAG: capsular polysaccharide biosynthesis protein [Neisseriaceae bacterium]|nr:capsular polysaccharide biosynthesis protein [Neisseriaceae bacterium]